MLHNIEIRPNWPVYSDDFSVSHTATSLYLDVQKPITAQYK